MTLARASSRSPRILSHLFRRVAAVAGFSAMVSCSGSWTLRFGGKACSVHEGMTIDEVRAACGRPTSSGTTPEVWQRSGCAVTACSAPGDIYETWLVRYDCGRRVMKVEGWPAGSFVEGS